MQIVIDIPEEVKNRLCFGVTYSKDIQVVCEALNNGTPLPKGHGRLIDVNDLLDRIGLEDNDENRENNVGEIITLEDFDFTPTIIEADEAESEKWVNFAEDLIPIMDKSYDQITKEAAERM